ncbi:MAG TPA: ABC transporter permease [Candidatus Krumholzibacteria bacterium]|nr:ABC transporter permease [Candidatus Krumholzibacteria bacterium]
MRAIATVFKKEMIDTLRDRRAIMLMIVLPLILFPTILKVMVSVGNRQAHQAQEKILRVACIDQGNAARFVEMLKERTDVELVHASREEVASLIRTDSLDGAFLFASNFDDNVADMKPGRIDFYYKSSGDEEIIESRLRKTVDDYQKELLDQRFKRLELDQSIIEPVKLESHNVASIEERVGNRVGGMIPYMFILFCFIGAMYPAIDLGAGEKERGTLETLLTAPVNRFHILLGKFGVVVASGLLSAAVSMTGLFFAIKHSRELPPQFLDMILRILGWDTITLLLSLLLPLTIFFAGVLLSVSLTARSFKEAQSMISPMNIAVIVPAAIGLTPGIVLNHKLALVPVLNVSLATKAIIAGTVQPTDLAIVYLSLIVFAVLSLAGAAWWFGRESTIFRS